MAIIRDTNNYKLGKIGQAGVSSKEQGYITEINNASDALASIFTSPTGWTDLVNVLDILNNNIDSNAIISERQKTIAEKLKVATTYKKEVIKKLETIRNEIDKSEDKLLNPAKSAILQEIAEEANLIKKTVNSANNIGRQVVGSKNKTGYDLKKAYIEQIKKSFKNDSVTANKLIDNVKNYRVNDSDISDIGISDINEMISSALGVSKKEKDYVTSGTMKRMSTLDVEKTAKRLVDEALDIYAPQIKGSDGYKRQGAVESFYQSVNFKMQQILNGSYIKERVRKDFGEKNKKINEMTSSLANGQNSIKSKLENLSKILEKEQYEMYIAASNDNSKIRIGAYKSTDSGKIFNRDANTHKIKSVDWDKMANFELGLDLDGLINHQGLTKINQWNMNMDDNGQAYLETLQEKMLDNILKSFEPTFSGKESWGMKALKSGDLSALERVFRTRINSTMSSSQGVGSFKRNNDYQDVLNALSGSGSQGQRAIKTGITSVEDFLDKIIYNNKISGLYPKKSSSSSRESQLNSLKTDLYQIALTYGLGGQESLDKLILQNKDFDYLTQSSNFGKVLEEVKQIAALPINMSSIKEGAAASFLVGTTGQDLFSVFGELARGSDRSYAQTQNILKKMRAPRKGVLKNTMLASSSGIRKGIDNTEKEYSLYNIGYITEKQLSDAYKEFKDLKMSQGMSEYKFNNKFGALAPSVTNDSGIYSKNIERTLDAYRYITKRLSEDEYNSLFSSIENEGLKRGYNYTIEDIQKKIANKLFGFDSKNGDKFERVLLDRNSNEIIFGFNKAQKMSSGTKLLNMATGTRYTGQGVNSEFFDFLKSKTGYKDSNIQEFLSADKFKLKNIAGILSSRLHYFLSEAKKNGMSSNDISNKLLNQKSLLSEYLKYDSKKGKFVNQFNIDEKLREISKNSDLNIERNNYAQNLRNLFNSIEDLGVELGLQEEDNRGLTFDENGNMLFGKNFITSSAINQADIYHYDESVGDLSDDELFKSRHTFSQKERDSIKRQIGIVRAKNNKSYVDLENYLNDLTATNPNILKEYKEEVEKNKRAIIETSYSGTDKESNGVSIGFGDQYDINLEKELNHIGFTEGGVAQEDFINSIYQKIADKQEEYRNKNGLTDGEYVPTYAELGTTFGTSTKFDNGAEYVFGGKRVYIPNNKINSRKVGEKTIYDLPSTNKELSSLLNSILDYGKSGFINEDLEQRVKDKSLAYMQAVYNDAYNKDGHIWQMGNKIKLKNSGVGTVNSVNSYDVLNEDDEVKRKILNSSLQFSLNDVANMISGDDKSLDYYNTLKLNYEDIFGKSFNDILNDDGTLNIEETNKQMRNKILSGLTIGTKDFEERIKTGKRGGLRAMFHRYPSTNGLDERFTEIFINKALSDGMTKVGLGLARAVNADSDGDHVYAALTTFGKGVTKSTFKDLDDLQLADKKISEAVASVEAQSIMGNKSNVGETALPTNVFEDMYDKNADVTSSILAKMNKSKVGVLSNLSTALRNILKDEGLDEISAYSDIGSQRNAAKALISRGIFESMEQKAISSKKVEDRILAKARENSKNQDLSDEDIMSNVLTEIDNLVSNFYSQDITKRNDFIPEFIDNLQKIGILGEDENIFEDRIGAQIMATIQQFSHGDEILSELFGEDNLKGRKFTWDKNGKVISGNGQFSIDVAKKVLGDVNSRATKYGKTLMEQLTFNKNVDGKVNAQNNPAYALSKVDGVNQDYSNAIDVIAAAHNGATEAIEKHSEALKAEIGLEKEKIKVAKGEAEAVGKTANAHDKNTEAVNKEADAYVLNGKAGLGNSWQDGNVSKMPRQALTSYINKVLPAKYQDSIDYSKFNTAINTMSDDIYEKLKNPNITDAERMKELGIVDPNIFNVGKTSYRKTQLGTLSHSASETLLNVQRLMGEQTWNNTISGIDEWLKNNADNENYSKVREFMEKYKQEEEILVKGMQLLGYSQENIDFSKYDAEYRGSENVSALRKIAGSTNSNVLNPEFAAYMGNDNTILNGIIDAMAYDKNSGTLSVFDYKNTGKVGANYSLQLLLYEEMMEKLQSTFREKALKGYKKGDHTVSIDRNNLSAYTLEELKSVFGENIEKIGLDTLDAILNFKKVNARLIQSDNNANTHIWRAVDRKGVSSDILQKIERGELLTEEEQKQLTLSEEFTGSSINRDSEYRQLKENDKAISAQEEYRTDLKKRIDLEKELLEILAKITVKDNVLTEKEVKNAEKRIKKIQEETELLDKKYSEEGEKSEWNGLYVDSVNRGIESINIKDVKDKAQQENDKILSRDIDKYSDRYLKKIENEHRIEEQIKNTEIALSETSRGSSRYNALNETLSLLEQELAISKQNVITLNEKNSALVIGEGENRKILSLNEEQLQNLVQQRNLSNSRHLSNLASATSSKPQVGLIEELFGNFQRQIKYMTTQSVVYKLIGGVQQTFANLISTIKELDKAMVDLQIASGYSRDQMKEAIVGYNKIATETGRTTTEVLTAANDWLRAGYDIKNANILIKDSMKLSTLGMIDSAKATEYLISTMKGWKLRTDEVADAVDDLTALDMAFATSAGDIAQAMAKGNVSASLAGMDRKTYEAMLTAVMDVGQQGADVVGTAFKTLFARYGNVKSGKYANNYNSSESDSEANEETVKLNDIETVLDKVNIKTRNSIGQFRNIDEVLADISEKWNTIDQVSQNAITTALGGTRQREVVNTLFENWSSVEKAKRITEESNGTADQKMANYTSSIEAAQKGLQNSIEKLTTGKSYEKWIIAIYNILRKLVDNLNPIIGLGLALLSGKFVIDGGLNSIGGKFQNISKYTTAPAYWMNEKIQNYKERKNMSEEEKRSFKRDRYISKVDSSIVSANARMKDNEVAVRDANGGLSIITTEEFNEARKFLTKKNNNFGELANLTGRDWENAASAIEGENGGVVGDWLRVRSEIKGNTKNETTNEATSYFYKNRNNMSNVEFEASYNAMKMEQKQNEEIAIRQKLINKLGLAEDATDEEIKARLRTVGILDEYNNEVKTDSRTIRTRGKVATDRNVNASFKNNPDDSNFFEKNGSTIGMVGGMVGTIGSAYAANDMSSVGGTTFTAVTSSLPMIGGMIGALFGNPGIGTAVGGTVSGVVGGVAALWAALNKTSEEILAEAQKANEELSKFREEISNRETTKTNLEDNEVRFAELVKGVNSVTGKNVSLSDSEWSEYQNILSSVIDSRDDLYTSYDEEGNIVAKNAEGIADLNKVMSESIQIQKDKIREEYNEMAAKTEDQAKEISGDMEKSSEKYSDKDKGFKLNLNNEHATINTKLFAEMGQKYNANVGFGENTAEDIESISNDIERYANEYNDSIVRLVKKGISMQDFVSLLTSGQGVSETEAKEIYSKIINSDQVKAVKAEDVAYSQGIQKNIGYALKGNLDYNNLDNAQQDFIYNKLFGNLNISSTDKLGKKKKESEIKKDIEKYQQAAVTIVEKFKSGDISLDAFENYNKATATMTDEQNYLNLMESIVSQMDISQDEKDNLLKGYGFTKGNNNKWITKRQSHQEILTNKDKYGFSSEILNGMSTDLIEALYTNRDALKGYAGSSAEELQRKLKEFTLGNNGTLSEYLSDFSNEMGVAISNTKEFAKALDTAKGKGTFAFEKLQKLANSLGIDIHELADHTSTLGSIDANGYNSKSLSEIETQFEDIENIVNDLTDNSTISAENVEKIIEDFPELVKYLDDSDKLLEKFQSLQGDKSKSQVASLKRSFAESDEVYKSLLNDTKFSNDEDFDKTIDQKLGMFVNGKKLTEFMNIIYNKDENGKYSIKDEYNMPTTDISSYSQNSWEKLIGENIFGIDTSTGTKEDIQKKIYNAMKSQAEKMGIKDIKSIENGGMDQLVNMYTDIIGQTDFMAAFQQVSDLQNQLSALKTAKAIEDSKWEQRVSDAISKLKQDFEEGRTSIDDYIKGLQQIKTWANLTAEQQNELNEAIEEARFNKVSDQYEKGAISVKAYRDELSALMKLNASGSSQYKQYADAYISSYDTEFNKLEAQMSLVAEKDFAQQENILAKERLIIQEELMALVAAGMQDSEKYLEKQKELKSIDEKRLEIGKKIVELHKEDLETTMSAYTTLLDYGISQLEKEKSLLEERYDEEIDKLKEVNDQKQRSIDLEKYQQQLENAKKEKSRVYVAGVGWTYRANQAKVDEAQRNLDNYLDDRKISDLEGSKNREAKYYQDQIDFYNEMKEKVEDVPKLASAEDAVRQLIKDGILPEGSTIPDSLNTLRQNTKLDNEGHVVSLGGKFESIKNDYLTTTEKLWDINSAWDQNLLDIANKIRASEPVTTEMLKGAFRAGASQISIKMPENKSTVYKEQIADIQKQLKLARQNLEENTALIAQLNALSLKARTTDSPGVWGNGKYHNQYTGATYIGVGGVKYYAFKNTQSGNVWWTNTAGKKGTDVKQGTKYFTWEDINDVDWDKLAGFSSGIEAGMVTRTGMYKLHGSPSNPEFVLNSKQAYQLLKNISTLSIPAFESNSGKSQTIKYQFYGDLNLPNVQDPSTFFDELLRETNSKFNVSKPEYS